MRLAEVEQSQLARLLNGEGLCLRTGPFVMRLRSPVPSVLAGVERMYPDYEQPGTDRFVDFEVALLPVPGLRRHIRPQVHFVYDGRPVFEPMPVDHAYPLLEWAMNWCVATRGHQYLLLHAAAIERNGFAAIFPAPPGSGKSTLCAALIHAGWRLVSDEMALVARDGSNRVWPLCRPVSLKNRSIEVMQSWAPQAVFNPVTVNTNKGNVTHMRAPSAHVARMHDSALARWVIFPKWVAGSAPLLAPRSRARSVLELGRNAFNAAQLGEEGFELLADLVQGCDCHDFQYSRLEDAVALFERLAGEATA